MIKVSKKQFAFILVAVCLVGLIGIGISYSYYLANISTSNEDNKNSDISTTTITKVVMDMQGKVSSDGAYPGHKMVKEVVVRGIGESNSIPANAAILVTPDLGDFTSDVTWKLYKSDTPITCSNVEHTEGGQFYEEATCNIPDSASLELEGGADKAYKNIVVKPNTETKYYLVVEYANKENQNNQIGKSFSVDIGLGEKVIRNIKNEIIAQLDTTGKCPSVYIDGTVNVSGIESTREYICSAPDAYGTSYYYRGNVTNNYVDFAGYYWRIVRINGDGSIRLIYDGTVAHENGESSSDRQIGNSPFNEYWKKDNVQENMNSYINDNAGVGYMYGNRETISESSTSNVLSGIIDTKTYYVAKEYNYNILKDRFSLNNPIAVLGSDMKNYIGYYTFVYEGLNDSEDYVYKIFGVNDKSQVMLGYVKYGTSSKENAQTNINDSTIKKYLDDWYEKNIKKTMNEHYIADNIFCNDRSFEHSNTGIGAGVSETKYRWNFFSASSSSLICPQQNDAFTVSDTTYGNGALKYSIGLITTDEVILAGGNWNVNSRYYLYSGETYWTISPNDFYADDSSVRTVEDNAAEESNVTFSEGVRPVINIKPEALKLGSGTMDDPYRVE